MHLTPDQSQRFFDLLYPLFIYANQQLHIADEPYEPWAPDADPNDAAELAREIWGKHSILDTFIRRNPLHMNAKELAQLRQWKCGIHDHFYLVRHTPLFSLFLSNERVFGIVGISRDIQEMLPDTPDVVETVILPFEGKIVYASCILSHSQISYGPGIQKMIQDEYDEAVDAHPTICTAQGLVDEYPDYIMRAGKASIERTMQQIEDEANADAPVPGTHAGALVGLSEQEREKVIHDYLMDQLSSTRPAKTFFERSAVKGPAPDTLEECLKSLTKDTLVDLAREFALKGYSKLRKAELAAVLTTEIAADVPYLNDQLLYLPDAQYESFKTAFTSGNTVLPTGQSVSEYQLLHYHLPLDFLFVHDGSYILTVPHEIKAALADANWPAIDERRRLLKRGNLVISAYTDICGILTFDDLFAEYSRLFPRELTSNDLFGLVLDQHVNPDGFCRHWRFGDTDYVVTAYYDPLSSPSKEIIRSMAESITDEEWSELPHRLRDSIECFDLLNHQKGKPLRHLTTDDLKNCPSGEYDLFDVVTRMPSIRVLRDYLDAHVPDDVDDYFFADKIIEDLYFSTRFDDNPMQFIQDMQDQGLMFDNLAQMNHLLQLCTEAQNDIPRWSNRGWSPSALAAMTRGKKKVGRNDPCPCGSGKKYKKCCGR